MIRRRWAQRTLVVTLVGTSLCLLLSTVASHRAVESSSCNPAVFSPAVASGLDEDHPGLAITASVYDTRTGCWFELNPELRLTTASAIKLQMLGANLDRVEELGRPLSATELDHAQRMLHFSHNRPPATSLYERVGVSGMRAYSDAVGATGTVHTSVYGVTLAPARDLTLVALSMLHDASPGPLNRNSRQVARDLLDGVHPTQMWGLSAGANDEWVARGKNGFFPCTRCAPFSGRYTWRVASTGMLSRADGEGLAITVLTDGAPTQRIGVEAVESIVAHVARELIDDWEPGAGPFDDAACVEAAGGESGTTIARRLGLSASAWPDIRWVSGNEGPMRGQLLCTRDPLAETSACICPSRQPTSAHLKLSAR